MQDLTSSNGKLILSQTPLDLKKYVASTAIKQAEILHKLLEKHIPNMKYYHFDNDLNASIAMASAHARHYTKREKILHLTTPLALAQVWEEVNQHNNELAAIIIDPMVVFNGSKPALGEYLRELRRIAFLNQMLFVMDETYTGFRLGLGGAQVEFDVDADMVILGGALSGGYDLIVLGITEKYMPTDLFSMTGEVTVESLMAGEYVIAQLEKNRGIYQELKRKGRIAEDELRNKYGHMEDFELWRIGSIIQWSAANIASKRIFLTLEN